MILFVESTSTPFNEPIGSMICPCRYLSVGAVSACRYDLDQLTLGVDIYARIGHYRAK
ncbi:hypothetical protein [uncultured Campylobacter sp.]|uniref:hypothetical protein n=1 Tax=uncultured Campylobacter sp. TaxID=218934 RepID=UPI002637BCBF|nr:hypothetical protein [uncultured Campylobacter sp.]